MLKNTLKRYGLVAQVLHWTTAGLILFLLPLGVFMHDLPNGNAEEIAYKFWFYSLHKTIGIVAFGTALFRVFWALSQPHPRPLNSDRKLESFAAQTVHWVLYGCIILMPMTGWLHHAATEGFAEIWWPFSQDLPFVSKNQTVALLFQTAHFWIAVLLVISLFLHIGGALKHVVIDRDGTLARMIPGRRPKLPDNLTQQTFTVKALVVAVLPFFIIGGVVLNSVREDHTRSDSVSTFETSSKDESTNWVVDHEKSDLGLQILQSGNPVEGKFESWNAIIIFDSNNLSASKIDVSIDVSSLKLGGVTDQALASEFLNAAQFQQARFFAEEFADHGNGSFEAVGKLTLVGITNPLSLPFNLVVKDGRGYVEGQATLERLSYGIGAKTYPDERTVGLEVIVKIKLEADQKD